MLKRNLSLKIVTPIIVKKLVRYNSSLMEAKSKLMSKGGGAIHLEKDDNSGIATITIDNPNKRNAISGNMMVQLDDVITELESWTTGKGVLLKGSGNFFCSGGDISRESLENISDFGMLMSTIMQDALTRLYCLPMITISLIRGKAIGGGAEITTATDFRILSSTAEVSFVQGKMGLVTGWGGGTRLVKLLGANVALQLLATSKKLVADEALQIGFANKVIRDIDSEKLECEAKQFLLDSVNHDHTVIRAMKQIVIGARDLSLQNSLINEHKLFYPLYGGPANLEALKRNIKH